MVKLLDEQDKNKLIAATKALSFIHNNMKIGLGTGTTANIFIDLLAEKCKNEGLFIQCVATSHATAQRAIQNGLTIVPNSQIDRLDLCVDGADEFTSDFYLIKGGGGALLREKIIAQTSDKMIVITDESKYSPYLGRFPLPVEVLVYEEQMIMRQLMKIYNQYADTQASDFTPIPRKKIDGNPFLTDLGHYIVDLPLIKIHDPISLAHDLQRIAGIVDHGLFLNEASLILTNDRDLINV